MSVRQVFYGLLINSPALVAIVGDRIYDAGALGEATEKIIPAKPFIVTNHGPSSTTPTDHAETFDRLVDVWFYGEPGDYTIVERGLRAVQLAVHDKQGTFQDSVNNTKTTLAYCRFRGTSADFYDDTYRANTRYATYRLVGSTT